MALTFDPQAMQRLPGPTNIPVGEMNTQPGFFGRLAQAWQDPNVRQAAMATGLGLMRSPQFGQNGFDVASDALGLGMTTLQNLRERDRKRALEAEDRKIKEDQRKKENERAERGVVVQETNAATSQENVRGDAKNKEAQLAHADKQLQEAIRHNKSSEEIARLRAVADNIRATTYAGSVSRTPAEIQKINRLKAFYQQQNPNLTEEEADKQAMDYLSTAKGKSPRQLVIDAYTKKAQGWLDQQFDPTAQPTPEMREEWKRQAIEEVKFAEEAGADVTQTRGTITRPRVGSSSPTPGVPASGSPQATPSATPNQPPQATEKNPLIERQIAIWTTANATPQQISELIRRQGEDPKLYGY